MLTTGRNRLRAVAWSVVGALTAMAAAGVPVLAAGTAERAAVAAPPTFTCSQVTAMTLTREWYQAGFEQTPGIADDHWQLKARQSGYITEWADPDSDFWNEPVQSPCANGSDSPDRVVLTVLSWTPPCCHTQAEWEAMVTRAVNTFKAKYARLARIDLMTVVRGPGNRPCPLPAARGEYVSMPSELEGALAAVAAKFPNLVFVAPGFEAPACDAFRGGGPHLTRAGNAAVAKTIGEYFAEHQ